jgi:hypothetical protein
LTSSRLSLVLLLAMFGCVRGFGAKASAAPSTDSLGIDGIRQLLGSGDTTLSLDLTRSQMQRHFPEVQPIARSWDDEVWSMPRAATRPLELLLTFHWDSGAIDNRAVSALARPGSIHFEALNVSEDSLALILTLLRPVLRILGPPSACERDTSQARRARGAPTDRAIWRRNGAFVYWHLSQIPQTAEQRAMGSLPRGAIQLYSYRTSYEPFGRSRTLSVSGKDSGCFGADSTSF